MGARISITIASLIIVAVAYFAGAWLSAAFNSEPTHAAETCTGLCPGAGSGGNIGSGPAQGR
jgi:hypothetical protein